MAHNRPQSCRHVETPTYEAEPVVCGRPIGPDGYCDAHRLPVASRCARVGCEAAPADLVRIVFEIPYCHERVTTPKVTIVLNASARVSIVDMLACRAHADELAADVSAAVPWRRMVLDSLGQAAASSAMGPVNTVVYWDRMTRTFEAVS